MTDAPDIRPLIQAITRALPDAPDVAVRQLADEIAATVRSFAAAPAPMRITRMQARDEAKKMRKSVVDLERFLSASPIVSSVPLVACVVNGVAALDEEGYARLRADLTRLRTDLLAVLAATGDDPKKPQLELPEGAGGKPSKAQPIASVVLYQLLMRGAEITAAADTSPAVECVAEALAIAGVDANARSQVAEWIERGKPAG